MLRDDNRRGLTMGKISDKFWERLVASSLAITAVVFPNPAKAIQTNRIPASAHSAAFTPSAKPIAHDSKVWSRKVHLTSEHQGYVVDVTYPRFMGGPTRIVDELNRAAKHIVNVNVPAQAGTNGVENSYTCTYKVRLITDKLISIDFEFKQYESGNRPLSYHVPFNVVLQPGTRRLTLRRALGRHVDYSKLSDLCIESLQKQLKGDLSLPANTEFPKSMFNAFSFDKNNLYFAFAEGDVAPVALGGPTVAISYKNLGSMLARSSPLRRH